MNHAVARGCRRRLRVMLAVFLLLLAAGLSLGIGGALAGGSPSPAASGGALRVKFGTTFDADNLNPFVGYSGTSYEIFHLNYDFLVVYATDLSPLPELATSWDTSPDGKVWTFHLRHGVTWQDGEPFTAADVVFTYMYIIKNDLTAFTSYTNNIQKVEALDDFTVKMTCGKPKANMLRLWIPILPEHIWSKVPGDKAGKDYLNKPPIVGTGPFQVVKFVAGSYVKLVKNPYYWEEGKPAIDQLVLSLYSNPDTLLATTRKQTLNLHACSIDMTFDSTDVSASATTLVTFHIKP